MADDPLSAALRRIERRHGIAYASPRAMAESGADLPVLLAIAEQATGLVRKWKQFAAPGDAQDECADELRQVLASALLGEEKNDGRA